MKISWEDVREPVRRRGASGQDRVARADAAAQRRDAGHMLFNISIFFVENKSKHRTIIYFVKGELIETKKFNKGFKNEVILPEEGGPWRMRPKERLRSVWLDFLNS